jgi:hypothetical protein
MSAIGELFPERRHRRRLPLTARQVLWARPLRLGAKSRRSTSPAFGGRGQRGQPPWLPRALSLLMESEDSHGRFAERV